MLWCRCVLSVLSVWLISRLIVLIMIMVVIMRLSWNSCCLYMIR